MKKLFALGTSLALSIGAMAQGAFRDVPFETLSLGHNSGASRPAKMVIANESEWNRVWNVHTRGASNESNASAPRVDFSRRVVLAYLGGQNLKGQSVRIAGVVRGPRETVVYTVAEPGEKSDSAQPYHFAVIERGAPDTPLRFADALGAACEECVVE